MRGLISWLSISLIYVSVYISILYCFGYHSFAIRLEISDAMCLALFFLQFALTVWGFCANFGLLTPLGFCEGLH